MTIRSTDLVLSKTLDATTGYTTTFPVPAWADVMIVHSRLSAVAGTTPSFDFQINQKNPDGSGSAIAVPAASIDALTSAGNAFVAIGRRVAAVNGTNYDAAPANLSKYMELVVTTDRGNSDEVYTYKIWTEFIGYRKTL